MAGRFMKLFFDTEKLAATNARFRARMNEIDEESANVKEAIADAKAQNNAAFKETMRTENLKLKRAWSK
jgi:hypothetical protein